MKIKELCAVLDRTHCYIFTIEDKQYKTLALLDAGEQPFEKYHAECEKLRELAEANEYTVKNITLLTGSNACIAIELEKDGE